MLYKGQSWKPGNMVEAQKAGISMVLQEANTIPDCTVAENLLAGRFDEFSKFGFVSMKKANEEAERMLQKFGIKNIHAKDSINKLTFEDRKLIEIVRCVSDETEVFVVDETTTALSLEGRQILYKLIHEMKDRGKSVIFISHDMDEILEQCTDLTVLRDGNIIGHLNREEMDAPNAVQRIRYMMVGREIGEAYYREDYDTSHSDEVALELKNISFGPIKIFPLPYIKARSSVSEDYPDAECMRLAGRLSDLRNWNPEVWCEMEKRLRPVCRQSNPESVIFPKTVIKRL